MKVRVRVFCALNGARELDLEFSKDDVVFVITGRLRRALLVSFDELVAWLETDENGQSIAENNWTSIETSKHFIKGDLALILDSSSTVFLDEHPDDVIDLKNSVHFVHDTLVTDASMQASYISFVSASNEKRIVSESDLDPDGKKELQIPPLSTSATLAAAVLLCIMNDCDGHGVNISSLQALRFLCQQNDDFTWTYMFMDEKTKSAYKNLSSQVKTVYTQKLTLLTAKPQEKPNSPVIGDLIVRDFGGNDVRMLIITRVFKKTVKGTEVRPLS